MRLAALILTAMAAQAAQVSGHVRYTPELPLEGASVTLTNVETGVRRLALSDRSGYYSIPGVPSGLYKILVRVVGFQTEARIGIGVDASLPRTIDFTMRLGSVSEVVTVRDSAAPDGFLSGAEDGAGAKVRPEDAHAFPIGSRTPVGLLELAPGMIATPANGGEAGQISNLGARPNTNLFTVDGVNANNAVAGGGFPSFLPGTKLPSMTALGTTHGVALFDTIDEVRVEATESAPVPGGSIEIRTKAGTNEIHGSFFYSSRPSGLGANDWFSNRFGLGPSASGLRDEGGSAGGPLRRDHTYFYIAVEKLDLRQVYAWTTTVPSLLARETAPANVRPLLAEFPMPNGPSLDSFGIGELIGRSAWPAALTSGSARLDHVFEPRTRGFLHLSATPSWSESGYGEENLLNYWDMKGTAGLTHEGPWTQEARLSFSRIQARSTWIANTPSAGGDFYSQFPSMAADFTTVNVGGAGSVSTGEEGRNRQDLFQISDTLAHHAGQHQLRIGLEYLQWNPVRSGPPSSETVSFSSPTNPYLGPAAPIWVIDSTYRVNFAHLEQLTGFVQDTWRIHPALSVTYGVRWLWAKPPAAANGSSLYAVDESAGGVSYAPLAPGAPLWRANPPVSFDPKLALAWRLPRTSNTVLRGSWALFHDGNFAVATDQLNGAPYFAERTQPGIQIGPSALVPVEMGDGVSSNLRLSVYERWDVSLQHAWSQSNSITIDYSGLLGSGLLRRESEAVGEGPLNQLSFADSDGASNYEGLHAIYRRSFARSWQGQISYSWSHSIDLGSSDSSLFAIGPGFNARGDRGDSDFDLRHTLSAALSYTTPSRHGAFDWLFGQWTLGGLLYARTGFPVNVLVSETLNGLAITNYRPDLIPGVPLWVADAATPGGLRLNPQAFETPTATQGDLGRNSIRGFGAWQADLAAERPIRLYQAVHLAFRAEAFNALNHTQFADPTRFLSSPMFGESSSPLNLMMGSGSPASGQAPAFLMGGPRSLQLSLRLNF